MADMDGPAPVTQSHALGVGDVVSERYRIDAVLGEGGMGVVYRAEHMHLHKPLALKVLLPEWSSTPEVVARFEREAIAAGNIQSPHVASATDFGRLPNGSFFLVMEYVDGRTLRSQIAGHAMPPARALHIARGIASALVAAHALGIVHRDLKPENVMLLAREDDPDFVKVLDFGIAKMDAPPGQVGARSTPILTQVGTVIGTPDYMSPEQALGRPVDTRSDLYSLGVILFEMLTGRCPFDGGMATVLRHHVTSDAPPLPPAADAALDPQLRAVVRQLLAKSPDNRFANAQELLLELDRVASPRPIVLTPPTPPRRVAPEWPALLRDLSRRASRRPALVAAAVAAVVLVLLVAMFAGAGPSATEAKEAPSASAASTVAGTPSSPPPVASSVFAASPGLELPPPPSPSAAPSPSARSPNAGRRTGPGGIYIPPPSQWFR
jgi:serine/threonine-protein kinase